VLRRVERHKGRVTRDMDVLARLAGYPVYLWIAVAFTVAILLGNYLAARRRDHSSLTQLRQEWRRNPDGRQ
jgi:heme exporter protein D